MTEHRDDLLIEIKKNPASDAPRQVLADHLEQEGEHDRANLIQWQIKRAGLPWWDAQVSTLELQERAILAKREAEWRAVLPALDGVIWGGFSRGFVGKVAFETVDTYQKQIAKVIAAAPIESIVMRWPSGGKPPKLPALDQLRELTLVGTVMRPEDLKWLASCPLLSTVRALNLIDSSLRTGLPHLLKSPHLGNLEALRIPLSHIGNSGAGKLLTAKLPKLVELELSAGSDEEYEGGSGSYGGVRRAGAITSKGVLELAANANLARIRSLDLSRAKLGSEGLLMLLASVNTKGLRALAIRAIKDGDWDMDDSLGAFKSGPAGTLDELDISDNDLDPEGAHYLAEAKALRELKVLRLDNVKSNSFERLARASWVRSLRVLSCSELALPHFLGRIPEQLHTLQIAPSPAPLSKIVQHLAASPPPSLRTLDLRSVRVDGDGLKKLGELPLSLASLSLRDGDRTHLAGLKRLASSKLGAKLVSLDAGEPEIDRLPAAPKVTLGDGEYAGPHRYL
jgi:uncharacterized protein (TIGR02996 family)